MFVLLCCFQYDGGNKLTIWARYVEFCKDRLSALYKRY
jgi:hypothetical protein